MQAAGFERDAALARAMKAEREATSAKAQLMDSKIALRDGEIELKAATQEVASLQAALEKACSHLCHPMVSNALFPCCSRLARNVAAVVGALRNSSNSCRHRPSELLLGNCGSQSLDEVSQ
jgi:hypothetical protein